MRVPKKTILAVGALLLLALVPVLLILWAPSRIDQEYDLGRLSFRGPAGLGPSHDQWGNPKWILGEPVFSASMANPRWVAEILDSPYRLETEALSGRALTLRKDTFAPGHGGRDHYFAVYYPQIGEGIVIYFRTHERDYDAGMAEHYTAWKYNRWAIQMVRSMGY